MIYLGIDPGKSGALAFIRGNSAEVIPFDEEEYRGKLITVWQYIVCDKEGAFCAVEKVGAMPKQGVSSSFNFGHNAGFIEGLLWAYSIPYKLVTPQTWKKEFTLLKRDKDASVAEAHRLFPSVSLRPTDKCRKDNDGMAEALLIAEWGRRWKRDN